MTSIWIRCFAYVALFVVVMAAVTQAAAPNRLIDVIEGSNPSNDAKSASSASQPASMAIDTNPGNVLFYQLTSEFVKQGETMLKELQAHLTRLEQLVSTGFNPPQPVPTRAYDVNWLDDGVSSDSDPEKRDILSPTQRVMLRQEIFRRLREQAAARPLELPIGMRFKKFLAAATDLQNDQDQVEEKRSESDDRNAIREEIMRRLAERQRVGLAGMRAGK